MHSPMTKSVPKRNENKKKRKQKKKKLISLLKTNKYVQQSHSRRLFQRKARSDSPKFITKMAVTVRTHANGCLMFEVQNILYVYTHENK